MRNLKYAILGLLNRKPMTGYDIAKEFEKGLGNFWSANHSQIYPELKKLTNEGLVIFDTVIQGRKMEKKYYYLTDPGREEFLLWLHIDEELEPTPKDVLNLRVYLSDAMSDTDLINILKAQYIKRISKLRSLEKIIENNYGDEDIRKLDKAMRGDYFLMYGAILRERTYIDWLKKCITFLAGDFYIDK